MVRSIALTGLFPIRPGKVALADESDQPSGAGTKAGPALGTFYDRKGSGGKSIGDRAASAPVGGYQQGEGRGVDGRIVPDDQKPLDRVAILRDRNEIVAFALLVELGECHDAIPEPHGEGSERFLRPPCGRAKNPVRQERGLHDPRGDSFGGTVAFRCERAVPVAHPAFGGGSLGVSQEKEKRHGGCRIAGG